MVPWQNHNAVQPPLTPMSTDTTKYVVPIAGLSLAITLVMLMAPYSPLRKQVWSSGPTLATAGPPLGDSLFSARHWLG